MSGESCGCGKLVYDLVYACSGASDVGAVSDQAARDLNRRRIAVSSCAIGVAAGIQKILDTAAGARRIVVLDGCDADCARLCIERAGLPIHRHVRLTDMGMVKGQSPVNETRISQVTDVVEKDLMGTSADLIGE